MRGLKPNGSVSGVNLTEEARSRKYARLGCQRTAAAAIRMSGRYDSVDFLLLLMTLSLRGWKEGRRRFQ